MKGTQATTEAQWQNPATMVLEDVIRDGARQLLQAALEAEVADHIERFSMKRDTNGHRLVVRNGWKPERAIQTGIGPVSYWGHPLEAGVKRQKLSPFP